MSARAPDHTTPRGRRSVFLAGYALSMLTLLGVIVMLVWSVVQPEAVPFWRVAMFVIPLAAFGTVVCRRGFRRANARANT